MCILFVSVWRFEALRLRRAPYHLFRCSGNIRLSQCKLGTSHDREQDTSTFKLILFAAFDENEVLVLRLCRAGMDSETRVPNPKFDRTFRATKDFKF